MATDNIRYDDFIANVHADPAKPEASIMLAGFVGHGAEGQVRIYPDASLANWYDVAEGDVVHAMPVPDAKLGGSYVGCAPARRSNRARLRLQPEPAPLRRPSRPCRGP
jgi:hypothetical protein